MPYALDRRQKSLSSFATSRDRRRGNSQGVPIWETRVFRRTLLFMDTSSRQAIDDLRDLILVTEHAIEGELGGPLPMRARAELAQGLSRAFEIGAAYSRARARPVETHPLNGEASLPEGYVPPATPFLGRRRRRKKNPE